MRSTISGVICSIEKPGETRSPLIRICVKPPPMPRIAGGPPRPGRPPVVTPGRRRITSPKFESPYCSISSRVMMILEADESRRSVVAVRRSLTSMVSVLGVAGRVVAGLAASGRAVGLAGSVFFASVAASAGGSAGGVVCAPAAALATANIVAAKNWVRGGELKLVLRMGEVSVSGRNVKRGHRHAKSRADDRFDPVAGDTIILSFAALIEYWQRSISDEKPMVMGAA